MSTGTHRKPAEDTADIPRIPWAYYATGVVLFTLAILLAVAVSWLATPTYAGASTGYLSPAVSAGKTLHQITPAPDGANPFAWLVTRP
jgi:hypothetical protein